MFHDVEVLCAYGRAQAIEDGLLIDVTDDASEAGFAMPVAVTQRVWEELIVPDARARALGQDERGRLWDVLFVLFRTAVRQGDTDRIFFRVLFILKARQRKHVALKAVIGADETGSGVITIMLPEED